MRGEGAGPRSPRFPRRASLRGELGGRRGAGSRREGEVLGILGGTGSTERGWLRARGLGDHSIILVVGPKGCGER